MSFGGRLRGAGRKGVGREAGDKGDAALFYLAYHGRQYGAGGEFSDAGGGASQAGDPGRTSYLSGGRAWSESCKSCSGTRERTGNSGGVREMD